MAARGMSGTIREALERGGGIFRLAPCWVPRPANVPGGRLKLHPHDLYVFGAHRGGIDERWLASVTKADNGPGTLEDEGLSYIECPGGQRVPLGDVIQELGEAWDVLGKFFDNQTPIAHHMHQDAAHAARVGRKPKPEAYYFPPQLNLVEHGFPYSFLGLTPGTTPAEVRSCLERWHAGDNGILNLSQAYKLQTGTGWQINPGILHAPGSLVTYEVQGASDVGAVFQSLVNGRPMPWSALVKDVPAEHAGDLDYIVGMLDWEANVNPHFAARNRRLPKVCSESDQYLEKWIVYGAPWYSGKELTVHPGRSVTIRDQGPYGMVLVQGHGTVGAHAAETPSMIRFGQMTQDEFFVTAQAAREGVRVTNASDREDLVALKHFGPTQ